MHRKHCVMKLTFCPCQFVSVSYCFICALCVSPLRSPEDFVWVIVQPASLLLQSTPTANIAKCCPLLSITLTVIPNTCTTTRSTDATEILKCHLLTNTGF